MAYYICDGTTVGVPLVLVAAKDGEEAEEEAKYGEDCGCHRLWDRRMVRFLLQKNHLEANGYPWLM